MKLAHLLLVFILAFTAMAQADIIRPDMSEIDSFTAEWCAPNAALNSGSKVQAVCYGETRFQGAAVRALAFKLADQTKELYVDADFRGVTLLKPQFTIIGPVKGKLILTSETGQAAVAIDERGEVKAVKAWTPRLGSVLGYRPSR